MTVYINVSVLDYDCIWSHKQSNITLRGTEQVKFDLK